MPRGGERKPPARTPPGGPGRYSRRTDGQQIATPKLHDSDLQSGDIGKLRNAQRMFPLPAGVPQGRPPEQMRRATGEPNRPGGAAENDMAHLLTMQDERPQEPTTTGLDVGPGAGSEVLDAATPSPDIREQILEALYLRFNNMEAGRMLQDIINRKAAEMTVPTVGPAPAEPSSAGEMPAPETAEPAFPE